jgi:hypothetical protein
MLRLLIIIGKKTWQSFHFPGLKIHKMQISQLYVEVQNKMWFFFQKYTELSYIIVEGVGSIKVVIFYIFS